MQNFTTFAKKLKQYNGEAMKPKMMLNPVNVLKVSLALVLL